jgi:hypothetical protein
MILFKINKITSMIFVFRQSRSFDSRSRKTKLTFGNRRLKDVKNVKKGSHVSIHNNNNNSSSNNSKRQKQVNLKNVNTSLGQSEIILLLQTLRTQLCIKVKLFIDYYLYKSLWNSQLKLKFTKIVNKKILPSYVIA